MFSCIIVRKLSSMLTNTARSVCTSSGPEKSAPLILISEERLLVVRNKQLRRLLASANTYSRNASGKFWSVVFSIGIIAKTSHLRNIQTFQSVSAETRRPKILVEGEEDPRDAKDVDKAGDPTNDLSNKLARVSKKQTPDL